MAMRERILIGLMLLALSVPLTAKPPRRDGLPYRPMDGSLRPVPAQPQSRAPETASRSSLRALVIPVEFEDLRFSFYDIGTRLDRLLNGKGTGSVSDYFRENSMGAFEPSFDVTRTVRLSRNVSWYGADEYQSGTNLGDRAPEMALYEACLALDGSVDFSAYDEDGDQVADLVMFYFPGIDQADGGPQETLWSHQWDVRYSEFAAARDARFDGVRLGMYLCSAELAGEAGRFTGIAPTCHEYAHVLGLPDFYDTDGTRNGLCGGLYDFSLMSDTVFPGDNPPLLNAMERLLLGWMKPEDLIRMPGEGRLGLPSLQNNVAGRFDTATEGEFFLFEYRNGKGWDAAIPEGLYVYHADQSSRLVWQDFTARRLWDGWREYNNLNANGSHPCFYLIPAANPSSLLVQDPEGIPYPGSGQVRSCDPLDWENQYTDLQLSCIRLEDNDAGLYVVRGAQAQVNGLVRQRDGTPVSGASISLKEQPDAGAALSSEDGYFTLPLPPGTRDAQFTLDVSMPGFRSREIPVFQTGRCGSALVVLTGNDQPDSVSLMKYNPLAERLFFPLPSADYGDCMGAVRFTAQELFPHVGWRINTIRLAPYLPAGYEPARKIWVLVDFGNRRVFTRVVTGLTQGRLIPGEVDISDADLRIPEDCDIYVGYGVEGASYAHMLGATLEGEEGNSFYAPLNLRYSDWRPLYTEKGGTGYMDLLVSASVAEMRAPDALSGMGYASIDPGKGNWHAGDTYPLRIREARGMLPQQVTWRMDGEAVDGNSVTLETGWHLIEATVKYSESREEVLRTKINVR